MSSGNPARTTFSALCISAAEPSKNLPQPINARKAKRKVNKRKKNANITSLETEHLHLKKKKLTADEEGITGEHHPVVPVLHEPADAVLRVTRRVQARDRDAADLQLLVVARRQRHARGVLASPDGQLGLECVALCFFCLLDGIWKKGVSGGVPGYGGMGAWGVCYDFFVPARMVSVTRWMG